MFPAGRTVLIIIVHLWPQLLVHHAKRRDFVTNISINFLFVHMQGDGIIMIQMCEALGAKVSLSWITSSEEWTPLLLSQVIAAVSNSEEATILKKLYPSLCKLVSSLGLSSGCVTVCGCVCVGVCVGVCVCACGYSSSSLQWGLLISVPQGRVLWMLVYWRQVG